MVHDASAQTSSRFFLPIHIWLLDLFSWIFFTPTIHAFIALLEHSAELIETNNCQGLGVFSESGLECSNKISRLIRISLSCKTSQIENLSDCLNRMWVRTDIIVLTAIPNKHSFRRSESQNRFKGPFPLQFLADYYLNELVVD